MRSLVDQGLQRVCSKLVLVHKHVTESIGIKQTDSQLWNQK